MRNAAEARALWYYRLRGYRVLGTNVRSAGNEIDIIVRRGNRLVFCEVKSRREGGHGHPAEMVGAEKQRRLRRAAEAWLARRPDLAGLETSFEVVTVLSGRLRRIRDAF